MVHFLTLFLPQKKIKVACEENTVGDICQQLVSQIGPIIGLRVNSVMLDRHLNTVQLIGTKSIEIVQPIVNGEDNEVDPSDQIDASVLERDIVMIAFTAFFLGCVSIISLSLFFFVGPMYQSLSLYFLALGAFHFLEFVMTSIYHPARTNWSAFLLDHSTEYHIAFLLSILEYVTWNFLLPSIRHYFCCSMYFGLVFTLLGHSMWLWAMFEYLLIIFITQV